ncbi:hypothetical protein ACOSQ2_020788 [Xanthoceras sorbifolium]
MLFWLTYSANSDFINFYDHPNEPMQNDSMWSFNGISNSISCSNIIHGLILIFDHSIIKDDVHKLRNIKINIIAGGVIAAGVLIMATDEILRLCEALSLSEEDGPILDIAKEVQADVGPGAISQLRFEFSEFWIHIYNIPLACMNCKVARLIAEEVGSIVEFPMDSRDLWGKFLRIKVRINITKPLKRGIRMRLENFDTMITALIKYDRLLDFCYGCGYIGHSVRECHNSEVRKSIMEGVEPKFRVWLRASPLDRSKPRQRGEETSAAKPKAYEDFEDVVEAGAEGASRIVITAPISSDKREGKSNRDIEASPSALNSAVRQKGGSLIQDIQPVDHPFREALAVAPTEDGHSEALVRMDEEIVGSNLCDE